MAGDIANATQVTILHRSQFAFLSRLMHLNQSAAQSREAAHGRLVVV